MSEVSAIDWNTEYPVIIGVAVMHGVDPRFIRTIRTVENGGPGREFGVLTIPAPTYAQQLEVCCNSVAHRMTQFILNCPDDSPFDYASGRLQYSVAFIEWFGGYWAPTDAPNDPADMNAKWVENAIAVYHSLCS
jgi:hypothetical protein